MAYRIGFDAKRAVQNKTGLGNYSRLVIRILARLAPNNKYYLYIPRETPVHSLFPDESVTLIRRYPGTFLKKKLCSFWRVWGVTADLEKDHIDLFHGLSNELPLNIHRQKQIKSIVTIHDVIFLRYPQYYKWIDRTIYNYKFRKACERADCVIAVSECTKRDIIDYYRIESDKIEVVYQGCDALFKIEATPKQKKEVQEFYQLPERYILYVGSIEERKNLLLLSKALLHMPEDIQVIAVGRKTAYAQQVEAFLEEHKLKHRMRMISGVPFNYLPVMYQLASVFVYPSRFEGFGIPLLEALCSGVPAIGCTGSCLEEAGGPNSLYVDPEDEKGLAEAILRVWSDEKLRADMIKKGREYAEKFEEEALFKELKRVYDKVLNS